MKTTENNMRKVIEYIPLNGRSVDEVSRIALGKALFAMINAPVGCAPTYDQYGCISGWEIYEDLRPVKSFKCCFEHRGKWIERVVNTYSPEDLQGYLEADYGHVKHLYWSEVKCN
jgi:hypothetical protein